MKLRNSISDAGMKRVAQGMETSLLTDQDVAYALEKDGADAVENYANGEDIENPELGQLWDEAAAALRALRSYLD